MSNRLTFNNSQYGVAPTLGNILDMDEIRIVSRNFTWLTSDGYWFSQAGPTASTREFGLFATSGRIQFYAGGEETIIGNIDEVIGGSISDEDRLEFLFRPETGYYRFSTLGQVHAVGFASVGTGRVDGMPFRIGARSNIDGSDTSGTYLMESGDSAGDTDIYVDGVLVRRYQIPASGPTITDVVSGQDMTIYGTESIATVTTPSLAAPAVLPIYAIDVSTGLTFATLRGQCSDTAATVEYRVMQGATEIIGWTDVDDFFGGDYEAVVAVAQGEGYTFEVREDGGVAQVSSSFDAGLTIGLTGSSSGFRMYDRGTGTLNNVLHLKPNSTDVFARYENETITGRSIAAFANAISAQTGSPPVGCYGYGVGGSNITTGWQAFEGLNLIDFIENIDGDNLSIILDQCGYNDADDGTTITQSQVEGVWESFRAATRLDLPIITGFSQRQQSGANDASFIALWQAQEAARIADGNVYPLDRIDLEISTDNIHVTDDAAELSAQRAAALCLNLIDSATYPARRGPEIDDARVTGSNEITVTFDTTNTSYTALSPASAIAGFRVDGGLNTISSSVTSGNNIVLTTGSAVSVGDDLDFAGYAANAAGATVYPFTNYPLTDNTPDMPVRPLYTTIQTVADAVAPVISDVSDLNAQEIVTVTVDTYEAGAVINFNGVAQTTTEATATTLTCVMPRGGFGGIGATIAVTVTDTNGTSNTVNETFLAPIGFDSVTLTSIGAGSLAEAAGASISDVIVFSLLDSAGNSYSIDAAGYSTFDAASPDGTTAEFYIQDASDGYSAPDLPNSTDTKSSGPIDIEVPASSISILTFVPEVSAGGVVNIEIPAGGLSISTFAPTVTAASSVNIDVPLVNLNLLTFAPIISTSSAQRLNFGIDNRMSASAFGIN